MNCFKGSGIKREGGGGEGGEGEGRVGGGGGGRLRTVLFCRPHEEVCITRKHFSPFN